MKVDGRQAEPKRPQILRLSGLSRRGDGARRDPGTVMVRAGPPPWTGRKIDLGLRSQSREDVKKEPELQTGQLPGVRAVAG